MKVKRNLPRNPADHRARNLLVEVKKKGQVRSEKMD